jgi:hypothetical protein
MANPDRKDGGGLSLQTLVVASAASLTAAMVTSRLFPPGTIYASALTPVLVAAVSEALHRPAARAGEIRRQRRTMVMEARERQTAGVLGGEGNPLRGAPDFAHGADDHEPGTNGDGAYHGTGGTTPVRVHGSRRWGRIHPKVAIATGLAAFAIAAAVLTLPELLFGGAVANKHRTTFFGGGNTSTKTQSPTKTETQTTPSTTPSQTVTETTPAEPPAQTAPADTQTTPTDTQTTPTETQPAPTDTGTSTAPPPLP